jgi:hypothetical protein
MPAGIIFLTYGFNQTNAIMENITMPADHKHVTFTTEDGTKREGVYREILKSFVDMKDGKGTDDLTNIYPQHQITHWEYFDHDKNPNADIMVIL